MSKMSFSQFLSAYEAYAAYMTQPESAPTPQTASQPESAPTPQTAPQPESAPTPQTAPQPDIAQLSATINDLKAAITALGTPTPSIDTIVPLSVDDVVKRNFDF